MARAGLFERRLLFGRSLFLIFLAPLVIRHAVHNLAALILAHRKALFVGGFLHPVRQAIATEACEIHHVDVLHVGARSQVLNKSPVDRGFKFSAGLVVHGGLLHCRKDRHDRRPFEGPERRSVPQGECSVKFAHFSHVWGKPGMTPHQRYEELWRELQLCDGLDYDYAFCVEHHFRPDESWISSPSLFAVGAGARTKRLRIGPMGYIVPLYHPLRLAEEIAIVDQMLGGRMECGLVPGINADYFRPFGLVYDLRKTPEPAPSGCASAR